MRTKRRFALGLCLIYLFSFTAQGLAAGLFPSAEELFGGVEMPSLRRAALMDPVSEQGTEDGGRKLEFEGITAEIFDAFSAYLSESGCEMGNYSLSGGILTATLTKDGAAFYFEYDAGAERASVTYPAGTREESVDVAALTAGSGQTADVRPGDVVTFGRYEQDNDLTNGTEPIEWQVLEVKDGKALLLSRYGLDAQPYNTEHVDVTWETCTLRSWLNGEFLNTAFTATEQKSILTTTVDNSKAQGDEKYDTSGGKDTRDKVFLLSIAEADRYFGGIPKWDMVTNPTKMESRVAPTKYAIARGAGTSDTYKTVDGAPAGWWWLRSPGSRQTSAASVHSGGSRSRDGVSYDDAAVRPALWVDLDALTVVEEQEAGRQDTAKDVQAGDMVTFGHYEQDNDLTNGAEPIEWQVLEVKDGKALLLSRYGLDAMRYNAEWARVTWETCTLRAWLNGEFLAMAFDSAKQAAILTTAVDNGEAQRYERWHMDGGNDTEDKVFLLSYAEAWQYFQEDAARTCKPTAYAKARRAYQTSGNCWWWLRSPGNSWDSSTNVTPVGSRNANGVNYDHGAVRPALWVDLDALP